MSEAHHSSLCQVLGQCRQASSSELTFASPPSPHTVFAQFFSIRFPHHLGAWIPGTGQVNKRFASPHFSGYYIVQQAREERGTRESLLSSPCLPPFASLSRFALNFVLFCLYKLFWTQACPEGMGTNGTHRSHARKVPSLPNPTTRKGWPHHRGLRPLLFSNSSVGSFTSHKNRSVKVL